jgi:hypothetical protein
MGPVNKGEGKKCPDYTNTTHPSLPGHTYLTILGWLSSLSREISRMAVLGTPSVSLGEVEKAEKRIWLQTFLSPRDTTPSIPLGSQRRGRVL